MDEIIKNYFYDVNTGYVSANKLYQKMKDDKYNVTRKQIKEFYDNQEVVQKTKMHPLKSDRVYNSIVASQYGSNYQIDIIVYDRFEYHKYKYILCCVDVYSRYASCRAMTNRRNETILTELQSIFSEMGCQKQLTQIMSLTNQLLITTSMTMTLSVIFLNRTRLIKTLL